MRATLIVCLLAGTGAWADEPGGGDAIEAEIKKLAGTWEGFVVEGEGERPNRGPVHLRLTITESKMAAVDLGQDNKDMGSGTYKIDPAKETREIDATGVILPGKRERTFQGIYALDGDTLKWCVDNRQKARPTKFRTGNGNYLLVLKRVK